MAPESDPGYTRLLLLVGGIAADVKNILTRQDRQDATISGIENRIETLEAFKWKAIGGLMVVTGLMTLGLLMAKELMYG